MLKRSVSVGVYQQETTLLLTNRLTESIVLFTLRLKFYLTKTTNLLTQRLLFEECRQWIQRCCWFHCQEEVLEQLPEFHQCLVHRWDLKRVSLVSGDEKKIKMKK